MGVLPPHVKRTPTDPELSVNQYEYLVAKEPYGQISHGEYGMLDPISNPKTGKTKRNEISLLAQCWWFTVKITLTQCNDVQLKNSLKYKDKKHHHHTQKIRFWIVWIMLVSVVLSLGVPLKHYMVMMMQNDLLASSFYHRAKRITSILKTKIISR